MPTPIINVFAEKTGKSVQEVEKLYHTAKDIAAEAGKKNMILYYWNS